MNESIVVTVTLKQTNNNIKQLLLIVAKAYKLQEGEKAKKETEKEYQDMEIPPSLPAPEL